MSLTEFDIIDQYFTDISPHKNGVSLSVGDDCALLQIPAGQELAVTVDNLVLDTHFDCRVDAEDLGYKTVSVSVSDLAAMGAQPRWMTLCLTIQEADKAWLKAFSAGLSEALKQYDVVLVGGNIAKGQTNIASQLMGCVEQGKALSRGGAQSGDLIFVSGSFGAEALGLRLHLRELDDNSLSETDKEQLLRAWNRPQAQTKLGLRLPGIASSCIDVSDGLLGDLQHILSSSRVGARVQMRDLPLHPYLSAKIASHPQILQDMIVNYACAGEGYQLCFTVGNDKKDIVLQIASEENIAITCIGVIEPQRGLRVFYENTLLNLGASSYRHF